MEPFDCLVEMEQSASKNRVYIPRQKVDTKKNYWNGIGFKVASHHCVVSIKEVAEVIKDFTIADIPDSIDWFLGVTNIRGGMLPVIDLMCFLINEPMTFNRRNRILVISQGKLNLGLLVDEVFGLQKFLTDNIQSSAQKDFKVFGKFVTGVFTVEEKHWGILNLTSILNNQHLRDVQWSR